ncbi:MAG: hypothetical protein JST16_08840 [Bdellovibrionales bacterium]|nr:hypothetical protein [Bdellovibrionales bacterium]
MRALIFGLFLACGPMAHAEETEHSSLVLSGGVEERNEVYSPPPSSVYHSQYDNPSAALSATRVIQVANAGLFKLDNVHACGNSPAPCFRQDNAALGIQAGDQLESVNGMNYAQYIRVGRSADDIARLLNRGRTQPMTLVIRRRGQRLPPVQVMWGFEWHGQSF